MILTILSFIVVLGITITVHEFGHFAMAKLLKIRVLVFSIGFGPKLVGFSRGGTDYRISPFPIGGYVKMAGETFSDEGRRGEPDEFLSHPKRHRLLVAIAGPAMNILLAVVLLSFSYLEGVQVPRYLKGPATVGPVIADSIARKAGLRSGDRILSVRGVPVTTWEDMEIALATAPKDALDIVVLRGQSRMPLRLEAPAGGQPSPAALGFKFSIPKTVVAAVSPGSPASQAGLQPRDEILSVQVNGRQGRTYDEILNIISDSKGVPVLFELRRKPAGAPGGQEPPIGSPAEELLRLKITPVEMDGHVLIGFFPEVPTDLEKFGVVGAVGQSIRRNAQMAGLTFKIVGRIFSGSASVKTISGPLEIARISGDAARTGSVRVFLSFLALISLQLGVFNLLPIPILDGGVIALLAIEGLIRRDLSIALKERIVQVGFVFLVLLMGFVVINDLSKIVAVDRLFR